jgi:hypothetical protein
MGTTKNSANAKLAELAMYQRTAGCLGFTRDALVGAVVVMVTVAVAAEVPEMLTGFVDPKLKVGPYWAPFGLEVTMAENVTFPVKPPAGVTVMVEVFPVVAPGITVIGVVVRVNPGGTTVTWTLVVAEVLR